MAITHELISSQTITSNVATVEFNSIPQTYTDLLIKISARTDYNAVSWYDITLRFNGYTSQYGGRRLTANNGTTAGAAETNSYWPYRIHTGDTSGSNSGIFGNHEIYIGDYTSASRNKSAIIHGSTVWPSSGAGSILEITGFYWGGTPAAITQINMSSALAEGLFVTGSTFSLYGIKNS